MRRPLSELTRLVLATLTCVLALAGCVTSCPPPRFAAPLPAFREGLRIAVVGDLQRTAPFLEIWREQNDAERARVVAALAETQPDLLLITGDCVFNGGSDAQWSAFDSLTSPLRASAIPVASAFGNHEYWMGREAAEAHVFPRFPLDAGRHWFALALGPLRLVIVDSNDRRLGAPDWTSELSWFGETLVAFDRDPSVQGVLVILHHPPFTNSTITKDEPQVQGALLPLFARARKTLAMLSGHVHSYERFAKGGKTYVVSGGGGGPRAELATGDARPHPDDLFDGPALRDFNFTVYTVDASGVHAEVRGLARGGSTWKVMDRFDLPWATRGSPP